eukprot:g217.t1
MSRLLFPLIALLAHHTLGDDCGSECMAATFLQHQHQIAARVRTDPAARELMFREEPWSAADCEEAPWMCEAPFDCINSTGQVESWEKVLKRLAKPSGVNMQEGASDVQRMTLGLRSLRDQYDKEVQIGQALQHAWEQKGLGLRQLRPAVPGPAPWWRRSQEAEPLTQGRRMGLGLLTGFRLRTPKADARFMPVDKLSSRKVLKKQYMDYGLNIQVPKGAEDQFLEEYHSPTLLENFIEDRLHWLPRSERFETFAPDENPVDFVMKQLGAVTDKHSDEALTRFCLHGLGAHRVELEIRNGLKYFVVRTNCLSVLPTRRGFERYGGDAYFFEDWRPAMIVDRGQGPLVEDLHQKEVIVRPGEKDWERTKFRFRSSLFSLVTLVDHLQAEELYWIFVRFLQGYLDCYYATKEDLVRDEELVSMAQHYFIRYESASASCAFARAAGGAPWIQSIDEAAVVEVAYEFYLHWLSSLLWMLRSGRTGHRTSDRNCVDGLMGNTHAPDPKSVMKAGATFSNDSEARSDKSFKTEAEPATKTKVKLWQLAPGRELWGRDSGTWRRCTAMVLFTSASPVVVGFLTSRGQPWSLKDVAFDCATSHWDESLQWSDVKLDYCCENAAIGCERVPIYYCSEPKHQKMSFAMNRWCCAMEDVECDELNPQLKALVQAPKAPQCSSPKDCPKHFDCNLGADKWWIEWTPQKIQWCCQDNYDCSGLAGTPAFVKKQFLKAKARSKEQAAGGMFKQEQDPCKVSFARTQVQCPQCSECTDADPEACRSASVANFAK